MSKHTFINYKDYRWLIITIVSLLALLLVYALNTPIGGRSGGTFVGYTYGVLATLGIAWLMAYAGRKRAYSSSLGTVEGWLAAHIWIGIGLLLLVPLHAGFSFGCNVHTLAYYLMVGTIVSGIWGVMRYATLSDKISSHRGGRSEAVILEQIASLSSEIDSAAKGKSDAFLAFIERFDFTFKPRLEFLVKKVELRRVHQREAGEVLSRLPESEREEALRVIGFIDQKIDLAQGLITESRVKFMLRAWLFIHVPISVALCVAVAIHIFSVFFFR